MRTARGRAFSDLAAVIEHKDAVRNVHHQAHIVLDQENGEAVAIQLANELADAERGIVGNAGGRLVEQEKARRRGQRPRDLQKLAFAETQACGRLVGALGQSQVLPAVPRSGRESRASSASERGVRKMACTVPQCERVWQPTMTFSRTVMSLKICKILKRAAEPEPGAAEGRQTVDAFAATDVFGPRTARSRR